MSNSFEVLASLDPTGDTLARVADRTAVEACNAYDDAVAAVDTAVAEDRAYRDYEVFLGRLFPEDLDDEGSACTGQCCLPPSPSYLSPPSSPPASQKIAADYAECNAVRQHADAAEAVDNADEQEDHDIMKVMHGIVAEKWLIVARALEDAIRVSRAEAPEYFSDRDLSAPWSDRQDLWGKRKRYWKKQRAAGTAVKSACKK